MDKGEGKEKKIEGEKKRSDGYFNPFSKKYTSFAKFAKS